MSQIGNFETLIGRKSVFLDVDWSRIGTLETLIGSCALRVVHLWKSLMANIKCEIMVLACQVGPFHLKLTQINSEMNRIAKNKCLENQELDTRCRGEKLNATSNTCHTLHSVSLHYSMWYKKSVRKSDFHCERKCYSVECLCYYCNAATDRWSTPRLDEVQEQQSHIALTCIAGVPTKVGRRGRGERGEKRGKNAWRKTLFF